ncbi:CDP-alcohol phosphatidyltransferase family protein [Bauldia sp.]|uniref:CDP-alcohol phosphatidyltransferase family protein n=1 Tax=Bauldia sp. TaxID=2575872 RepID=UPI003BAA5B64
MLTLYALKPRFQRMLAPAARRLLGLGVTANQVTWFALGLSAVYGRLLAAVPGPLLLLGVPAILLLRMGLNAIDGMMARAGNQASPSGFALNEIGDVVADIALYLPLVMVMAPQAPMLAAATVAAFALAEFAGVLGAAAGSSRRYDGPFGKSDRALFFAASAVLIALVNIPAALGEALVATALALALVTTANRVRALVHEHHHGRLD